MDLSLIYDDGEEYRLDYVTLRIHCPCANCQPMRDGQATSDEFRRDVRLLRNEKPTVEKVGAFGLRFLWQDRGCSSGIYGFDLLHQIARKYGA